MNLKQMEYFITIVNEGSISAASKILHISQPPLSTQMNSWSRNWASPFLSAAPAPLP